MTVRGVRGGGGSNLELYSWFFMRVSGVVLLFIAVFHLLYMHLVIGVDNITFRLIADRWQNPAWRLFDLLLLVFALTHGGNGARMVLNDVLDRGPLKIAATWTLYVAIAILILMGAQVLFTFQMPDGMG